MRLSDCGRRIVGEPSERRQTVSIPERMCAGSVRLNSKKARRVFHHDGRKGVTWRGIDGGK